MTAADPSRHPRVAFVFPNPRAELAAAVATGDAPDSTLLGQNHMEPHGIESHLHDPWLTRHVRGGSPLHRAAWSLREVMLPFELTHVDAAFTPLAALFPLTARVRRLPVVVVNYGLCLIHERAGRQRRELLAANLRAARSVVCLGETQRLQLIEQTGLAPERVRTVQLGIDAAWSRLGPALRRPAARTGRRCWPSARISRGTTRRSSRRLPRSTPARTSPATGGT